jgi:hypothetical protein
MTLQLISEPELRKWLKISRTTLYRYRTTMKFPYIKVGGKIFYHAEQVEAFFSKHSSCSIKETKYAK